MTIMSTLTDYSPAMDPTIVPVEKATIETVSELHQISVADDSEIAAVNELLSQGWRLLHIGHLSDRTIYVLGKQPEQSRRRTGFLA